MTTRTKEGPSPAALVWRRSDLMAVLAVSPAQLAQTSVTPGFPKSKPLGLRGRFWLAEDIRKWLRDLPDVETPEESLEDRAVREGRRPAREPEPLNQ